VRKWDISEEISVTSWEREEVPQPVPADERLAWASDHEEGKEAARVYT